MSLPNAFVSLAYPTQFFRSTQVLPRNLVDSSQKSTSRRINVESFPERDSFKDRTIVTLFILATASLLLWALLKPFIVKSGVGDVVQRYTPIRTGLSASEDDGTIPRPNANSRAGFGSERPGRSGGGRGSISRQGGLNS